VFLLRILAVKNSKNRSAASGAGRNSAGGLAAIAARLRGTLKGTIAGLMA